MFNSNKKFVLFFVNYKKKCFKIKILEYTVVRKKFSNSKNLLFFLEKKILMN